MKGSQSCPSLWGQGVFMQNACNVRQESSDTKENRLSRKWLNKKKIELLFLGDCFSDWTRTEEKLCFILGILENSRNSIELKCAQFFWTEMVEQLIMTLCLRHHGTPVEEICLKALIEVQTP